ncbi:MAG: hypothetical protein AAFQ51_04185, partial [Pseudomonadota bacterium]
MIIAEFFARLFPPVAPPLPEGGAPLPEVAFADLAEAETPVPPDEKSGEQADATDDLSPQPSVPERRP